MKNGMHVVSVHAEIDDKTNRKWYGWACTCGAMCAGWWNREPTQAEVEEDALEHTDSGRMVTVA